MSRSRVHLASLVEDFDKRGSETAIVTFLGLRERRTTYRELARLSRRFACELQLRNIAKGDRVILWGNNSAFWVGAFFGCVLNGSLPVPVDVASSASFVQALVSDVAPKLLLADDGKTASLTPDTPFLPLEHWPGIVTDRTDFATPERLETDPLQIIFTSGTTGTPKGVVHTHQNVLASVRPIETEMQKYLRYERPFHPIRILHTLPLSHVFGQFMGLWVPPLLGAEIHYQHRLVANELVEYIRDRRISVLAAPPRILDLLQSYLTTRFTDLAARLNAGTHYKALGRWWHFRNVHQAFGFKFWAFVCGGASLPAESERFWNGLGFVVIQGYGMTETTALVSLNHPFKLARGTVGQVLPGRQVRLSEQGEVLVRGETVATTTWYDGKLQTADSEWLATGDLAEMDGDGNLRFRGRLKEVIVTSAGLNIYPEDLEAAVLRQTGVKACGVVEFAGPAGPEPLAVVVTETEIDLECALRSANRELAEFQQVRRWIEWPDPDLPRTSTGKVLRREIVRRVAEGELTSKRPAKQEAELNLDSLGRVQLQAELEAEYGVALDDRALQEVRTDTDLQQLVRAAHPPASKSSDRLDHSYPHWPWHPLIQRMRWLFWEALAMPLVRLLTKPIVIGRPVQAPTTPVLLVANHVTSYDVPFLLYALPASVRRKVAVAMSGEMILDWRLARRQGHWFLDWIAPFQYFLVTALFNIFPLPQLSGFRRSFRHAGEAMDAGYNVLIFPEGRRSDDGEMQRFKSGAGLLWKELSVPALPLYLGGLGEIKLGRKRWFRAGTISIAVGSSLLLSPDGEPERLAQQLRDAIADLQMQSKEVLSRD